MNTDLAKLLTKVIECAKFAGEQILSIYHSDFNSVNKENNSPLTAADMAAHHYIVNYLQTITPGYPILSEESSAISWQQRQEWQRYWLVDPLDGTKEFIKRNGEFTVNIALIDQHRPILGVIYAPDKQSLYFAAENIGAYLQTAHTAAQAIKTRPHQSGTPWKIVASRSHPSPELTPCLSQLANYELISMGSSLKFCAVATGNADFYPRFGPTSEWDTAAAQCLVEQAGGVVVDINLQPLRYNQKPTLINPSFLTVGCQTNLLYFHSLIQK